MSYSFNSLFDFLNPVTQVKGVRVALFMLHVENLIGGSSPGYDARSQLDLWNTLNEKDQNQFIINSNQKSPDINTSGQVAIVSAKPNLQDWLKNNRGKTINDYFSKFGR